MSLSSKIIQSPQFRNGAFQNISPTHVMAKGVSIIKVMADALRRSPIARPPTALPSVKTDLLQKADKPWLVWFGHSSYLLGINGKTILVDPVFSGHASPISTMVKSFRGTDIFAPNDFPDIDVLLITHNHYDHLDKSTIRKLAPKIRSVCTTLRVGADIPSVDRALITELDWNETAMLAGNLQFTALPARHFSGRGLIRNKSLWASFALKTDRYNIYLGGDSGYDQHFKSIGEKFGPFDLVVLECGQYNVNWPEIHMMPEETVRAAIDLKAATLLPVHWAKFALGLHAWNEPIIRVTAAAAALNLNITTPQIGERVSINGNYPNGRWWDGLTSTNNR